MAWFKKAMPIAGSVIFRGSLPPRLEQLRLPPGAAATRRETPANAHWSADLESPALGRAEAICLRNPPRPPRELFAFDRSLSESEKEEANRGRALVTVRIEQSSDNLLRDRKRLLTWLGAVFDEGGVVAMDHASTRPWSRAMLDDELAHDADVDVSALYALHAITGDDPERCDWLHTHGLAELGKVDFDILRPAPAIYTNGADPVRAFAFAALEDKLKPGLTDFTAFHPGGVVGTIDAAEFDARGPAEERAWRSIGPDDNGAHTKNRVVMIDPPRPGGLLARLFNRGGGVRASRALSGFPEDRAIVFFSNDAGILASKRAQKTWSVFRDARAEFEGLPFATLVKIAYRTDRGDDDFEHLWFEVHDADDETVDATLMNEPFNIAKMKQGERGRHEVKNMSDWQIMTPVGSITPRSTAPLRALRERPEALAELRKMMAERGDASDD